MIVFVGRREGALAAAARLGVEVVLVVERAPRRTLPIVRAVLEVPFATDDWSDVARRVRTLGAAEGVLALTESAVVPAARLRHQLDLPGLTPAQAFACTDKAAMKHTVAAAGLPCARFVMAEEALSAEQIVARLGLPLVIKPARSSGGRGLRRVETMAEMPAQLRPGSVAEALLTGTEMSIESLVCDGTPVFVNVTEYLEPRWSNIVPGELPRAQRAALVELNARAIEALGIERGITHLEAFMSADGVHFGELAARPPGGHLMELLERVYGFDPWATCIELERGKPIRIPDVARGYAGVRVLHPGPGVIERISGLEAMNLIAQCARVVCRVAPGDEVSARSGAGQEVGYVVFQAPQRDEVAMALEAARQLIRFELR